MNFIRPATDREKADFKDVTKKEPDAKFKIALGKQEQIAALAHLPFCTQKALADWSDYKTQKKNEILRKTGGVTNLRIDQAIPVPKIDWKEYSNLDNFDIVDTKEVLNPSSKSGHKPAYPVWVIKYRWKDSGWGNTVMFYDKKVFDERTKKKK